MRTNLDLAFLDSRPVNDFCRGARPGLFRWAAQVNMVLVIPDVIRYEVRRGILKRRLSRPRQTADALELLDELCDSIFVSPTTPSVLDLAAELWADAALRGVRTSGDNRIDFDVIVAAQVLEMKRARRGALVLTSNVGHFEQIGVGFINWDEISDRLPEA